MRSAPLPEINRILGALRRRLTLQLFLRQAARATLFFYGVLLALRAAVWWTGAARPDPSSLPIMLSWPVLAGLLAAAVLTALRRPTLSEAAMAGDVVGQSKDRLISALQFGGKAQPTQMERLTLAETQSWLHGRNLPPLLRIRWPRELGWIGMPLAMIALLWWHDLHRVTREDAAAAAALQEVQPTLHSLETLAKQAEQRANANEDEKLRAVAERLKQSATQLRAEAANGGEMQASALRELAELSEMIRQLRQPDAATEAELKALAQALQQHESTKEAAQAIEENRFSDAARKLEEASQQAEAPQVEATLQQALDHLAQKKSEVSKQLEGMQQAQSGEGGQRQELLKQLAEMMRDLQGARNATAGGKGKEGAKDGKDGAKPGQAQQQMSNEDLQKLLGALQQMKDQQQQQQPGGEDGEGQGGQPGPEGEDPGDGSNPVTMFTFSDRPGGNPDTEIGIPSGQPGSEKDRGTTQDPFGKEAGTAAEKMQQAQAKGQLGEGESLSALLPAASAGDAKAARRYKELTDAAAAAAEDAVQQENIPLGSRLLIKRYFQAIRGSDAR